MRVGSKVKVLSTELLGKIQTIYWRAVAGSTVSYVSSVLVELENSKELKEFDPKLLEVVDEQVVR